MKNVFLLLFTLFVSQTLFGCHGDIKGSKAKQLVQAGALLLDVRTKEEFATKHIPNAINIPVDALESRLKELPKKERVIIVYCRSGARSGRAKTILKSKGYKTVHNLGSMDNWK